MDKKTRDEIQKRFIEAIIAEKNRIEKDFGVKTRVDFAWQEWVPGKNPTKAQLDEFRDGSGIGG